MLRWVFNNLIRELRVSASEPLAAFFRVHFGGLFLCALFAVVVTISLYSPSIKLVGVPVEIIHEYPQEISVGYLSHSLQPSDVFKV